MGGFNYERAIEWLRECVRVGYKPAVLPLVRILYGQEKSGMEERDFSCFLRVSNEMCHRGGGNGYLLLGARRYIVRFLLSGFLSKNQSSPLYQSFFRSPMAEVHLFSLISVFLTGRPMKCAFADSFPNKVQFTVEEKENVYNIDSIGRLVTFDCSNLKHLGVEVREWKNNRMRSISPYLPLLSSPSLSSLSLSFSSRDKEQDILSCFRALSLSRGGFLSLESLQVDSVGKRKELNHIEITSILRDINTETMKRFSWSSLNLSLSSFPLIDWTNLEVLSFSSLSLGSISFLSHCNLPSLCELNLGGFYPPRSHLHGLKNLEGLTRENTRNLKKLLIAANHLTDISALSSCDLSHLEELRFFCLSLSDISPLSLCNFSSITKLIFSCDSLEDLSPLSLSKLSSLKELKLYSSPKMIDISPFCRMDLSSLEEPIELHAISLQASHFDNVVDEANAAKHPFSISIPSYCEAVKVFEAEKRGPPLVIGNMTLLWRTWSMD